MVIVGNIKKEEEGLKKDMGFSSITSYCVKHCVVYCCIVLYIVLFYIGLIGGIKMSRRGQTVHCIALYCIVLYCIVLY